jgi:hypothetical protein
VPLRHSAAGEGGGQIKEEGIRVEEGKGRRDRRTVGRPNPLPNPFKQNTLGNEREDQQRERGETPLPFSRERCLTPLRKDKGEIKEEVQGRRERRTCGGE